MSYKFGLVDLFLIQSGTALGVVIYTGNETRIVMNTSSPESKVRLKNGLLLMFFCSCEDQLLFEFKL